MCDCIGVKKMIPAKVEIAIDEKLIRDQIEKRLDEVLTAQLWFVSVKRLATLMDMSERYLEDSILCDPRMKVLERRRNRKIWYPAEAAFKTILEITNEW